RDDAADIVVDPVVRLPFEHAEPGQPAVRNGFGACKRDESRGAERRNKRVGRDGFLRSLVEKWTALGQAARVCTVEEKESARITGDIEPQIVREPNAACQELPVLRVRIERIGGFP